MTDTTMQPFSAEGISITPNVTPEALRLRMSGSVEMRDPGDLLNPFWTSIDEQTRARGIKRVELDLRDVNFMNSSGILTLVRWITKAKTHAPDAAYQLILQYDRNVTWQRSSIPTLAKLAPKVVTPAEVNG